MFIVCSPGFRNACDTNFIRRRMFLPCFFSGFAFIDEELFFMCSFLRIG